MKKTLLKTANINHSKFLFLLYNYSIDNGFSISRKKINYKHHVQWLKDKLNDSDTKIYIGYIGIKKIGYVRFEKIKKNKYVVSIANHPNFIGKGLGSKLLKLSINKFSRNKKLIYIYALVKKNNLPSKKTFIKNNFKLKKKISKSLIEKPAKNLICYVLKIS